MPFRINHIHIKAADPRKAAEWWVKAFAFKIVSDETRVFGDRFIRCLTEDGGMVVSIQCPHRRDAGSGQCDCPFRSRAFRDRDRRHRGRHRAAGEARRPAAGWADPGAERRALRISGRAR